MKSFLETYNLTICGLILQVGVVGGQVADDQGEKRDNRHIPSQHNVLSDLHAKPVPTMSFHVVGTPLNTVSTAISPEAQDRSVVLDSRFYYPAILRRNEKNQVLFSLFFTRLPKIL